MLAKPLSKRKLKRYEIADDVCKELRQAIGYGGPGLEPQAWDNVINLLIYHWMPVAGKQKYERAKRKIRSR